MAVLQAPSQTAIQRFEHEFAQWFRWASVAVSTIASDRDIEYRLEILSRLAVWVVFNWMIHDSTGASGKRNRSIAFHLAQPLPEVAKFLVAESVLIPPGLLWPRDSKSSKQRDRSLWAMLSRYSATLEERSQDTTVVSPAVFGGLLTILQSASSNAGVLSLQKRNGCFDTPPTIADEMVLGALETFLATQIPDLTLVRTILRSQFSWAEVPLSVRETLLNAIAHLKMIDPACGAGIFPLQMAQRLEQLLAQLDPHNALLMSGQREVAPSGNLKMPAALWRRWFILTHCLYAIDVQPIAVEVTRMRCFFWLLAAVKHPQRWATPLLTMAFSEHISIAVGDALATDSAARFGVTGFDIAIANPPYVDSELMVKHQPELRKYYAAQFESAKGNWDLFVVFVEWGLRSLRPNGVLTYIVPNKLVGAPYGIALRRLLCRYSVTQIQDFSKVALFRDARVYPVVVTAQRRLPQTAVTVTVMQSLTQVATTHIIPASQFHSDPHWSRHFASSEHQPLLERCNQFPKMEQWFPAIAPAMTVREAYALQPMICDAPVNGPYKKLVNTGTIDRYTILWGARPTRYLKQRYQTPTVADEDLRRLNPTRLRYATAPKLIVGGMTRQLEGCYDTGQCVAGKSTTVILAGAFDLRYALALLNSPLASWWYRHTYGALSLSGGYLRISHRELKTLPMPKPTPQQERAIVECVSQRLNASDSQKPDFEATLNALIYQLYNLTGNDIEKIESIYTSGK